MTNLIKGKIEGPVLLSEPIKAKRSWRPKAEREAAKREREIRHERREAKRVEREERRKRREVKKTLRHDLAMAPKKESDVYQPKLKCRNCGGSFIVAMPRDPETGDNQPICERCIQV